MADPYLSVVVPCYNEAENLQRGVLQEMHAYLSRQPWSYEVIISDDGSTDNSRDLVRQASADLACFRLLANPHRGKPGAVWAGIQAAQGELVLFSDMDQSTPIDQLDKLLPAYASGYSVVIGSRGIQRANSGWYRRLGSAIFRTLRRLLMLRDISDTQCGFKSMRRSVALELFPRLDAIREAEQVQGWKVTAFDVELLYLAKRAGYQIAEVTVAWANRDVARGKGKSYLRESREMLEQICRIKWNEIRGRYDRYAA
jgi:dolichyl-phosphate beta-glucosyltransferase